jgi:hypothetical protein
MTGSGFSSASASVANEATTTANGPPMTSHSMRTRHQGVAVAPASGGAIVAPEARVDAVFMRGLLGLPLVSRSFSIVLAAR